MSLTARSRIPGTAAAGSADGARGRHRQARSETSGSPPLGSVGPVARLLPARCCVCGRGGRYIFIRATFARDRQSPAQRLLHRRGRGATDPPPQSPALVLVIVHGDRRSPSPPRGRGRRSRAFITPSTGRWAPSPPTGVHEDVVRRVRAAAAAIGSGDSWSCNLFDFILTSRRAKYPRLRLLDMLKERGSRQRPYPAPFRHARASHPRPQARGLPRIGEQAQIDWVTRRFRCRVGAHCGSCDGAGLVAPCG